MDLPRRMKRGGGIYGGGVGIGLQIMLVPKVLNIVFSFVDIKTLSTFIFSWVVTNYS